MRLTYGLRPWTTAELIAARPTTAGHPRPVTTLAVQPRKIAQVGYRYVLERSWLPAADARAVWIMLNPSVADDRHDDPTIRKCVGFTHRLGHSGLVVLNLYAYRATNPVELWKAGDPIGTDNDRKIAYQLQIAAASRWPVICAWGTRARPDRVTTICQIIAGLTVQPQCLGLTKDGSPRHPLYAPYTAALAPWPLPT